MSGTTVHRDRQRCQLVLTAIMNQCADLDTRAKAGLLRWYVHTERAAEAFISRRWREELAQNPNAWEFGFMVKLLHETQASGRPRRLRIHLPGEDVGTIGNGRA